MRTDLVGGRAEFCLRCSSCQNSAMMLFWYYLKVIAGINWNHFVDNLSLWTRCDNIKWITWFKILQVLSRSCWKDGVMESDVLVINGSDLVHSSNRFSLESPWWRYYLAPMEQCLVDRALPVLYVRSRMLACMNKPFEVWYLIRWYFKMMVIVFGT